MPCDSIAVMTFSVVDQNVDVDILAGILEDAGLLIEREDAPKSYGVRACTVLRTTKGTLNVYTDKVEIGSVLPSNQNVLRDKVKMAVSGTQQQQLMLFLKNAGYTIQNVNFTEDGTMIVRLKIMGNQATVAMDVDNFVVVRTTEGTFADGEKGILALVNGLKGAGLTIDKASEVEQHRHDEHGNHVHVRRSLRAR